MTIHNWYLLISIFTMSTSASNIHSGGNMGGGVDGGGVDGGE
jgi:hypothetical protein